MKRKKKIALMRYNPLLMDFAITGTKHDGVISYRKITK
jgi:hypothetical protein